MVICCDRLTYEETSCNIWTLLCDFLSSLQQIMLILVFPVKPLSQNDGSFLGYRPQITSVQLKIMVFICPKQYYKQKTYQD